MPSLAELRGKLAEQRQRHADQQQADPFRARLEALSGEADQRRQDGAERLTRLGSELEAIEQRFELRRDTAKAEHNQMVGEWEQQRAQRRSRMADEAAARETAERARATERRQAMEAERAADAREQAEAKREREARAASEARLFAELRAQMEARCRAREGESAELIREGDARRRELRRGLTGLWAELEAMDAELYERLEQHLKRLRQAARAAGEEGSCGPEEAAEWRGAETEIARHMELHSKLKRLAQAGEPVALELLELPSPESFAQIKKSLLGRKAIKQAFRELARLWHPDKFFQHFHGIILDKDKEAVAKQVNALFQSLQDRLAP